MRFKNTTIFLAFWSIPLHVHGQEANFLSFIHDTHISSALICSPDGKNVYASGVYTIAAFTRNPNGTLTSIQVLNNNHLGVRNIQHIIDMAIPPDGRHLYAVSASDQSLLIFGRDTSTGEITLQEIVIDSVFGGRRNALPIGEDYYRLFFSPDGKHLYWFYGEHGLLAVFACEISTGRLNKVQVLRNGAPELNGFNIPFWLDITLDGKQIYCGGGNNYEILILERNLISGKVVYAKHYDTSQSVNEEWQLGSITISSDGKIVYVTNLFAKKLFVFLRDTSTGELLLSQTLDINGPRSLITSQNNQHIYFQYYNQASYFAYYRFDPISSQLVLVNDRALKVDFYPPQPPSGIFMSPQGDAIYMTSDVGRSVIKRDTTTGELSLLQHFKHNVGGTDRLLSSHSVAVSPNGKFLYVSARGEDAGVSVFGRDQQSGELTLAAEDSVSEVTDMAMPPDGAHLYFSTSTFKNTIEIVSCNAQTGSVQWLGTQNNASVWPMTFSPDSRFFYNKNVVFERNLQSGELKLAQEINGSNHGLGDLRASAVSPDGKFFYWSGEHPQYTRHQLGLFIRDALTGQVTFKSMQELDQAVPGKAMRLSPDGRHAYVSAYSEKFEYNTALRIFARQPDTGELSFLDNVYFPGWCELRDLEITQRGDEVYVLLGCPGSYSGAIDIFTRDLQTGLLALRQRFVAWKDGVYGIIAPEDLALSPDERFFYVADLSGVATFATGLTGTSVVDDRQNSTVIPRTLTLEQSYPNPLISSDVAKASASFTTIRYEIPATSISATPVELAIYNNRGQRVLLLFNEAKTAGKYSVTWNGLNASGERLPAGVYFYRLKMGEQVTTRRLVIVR